MKQLRQAEDALEERLHHHPRHLHRRLQEKRTRAERMADWISSFAGSFRFTYLYIGITALWCVWNLLPGVPKWDLYPFIFYTFSVSVLAILMSNLILIAQNRQSEIETHIAHNAYDQVAEIDELAHQQTEILNKQNDILSVMAQMQEVVHDIVTSAREPSLGIGDGGPSPGRARPDRRGKRPVGHPDPGRDDQASPDQAPAARRHQRRGQRGE